MHGLLTNGEECHRKVSLHICLCAKLARLLCQDYLGSVEPMEPRVVAAESHPYSIFWRAKCNNPVQ